MLKIVSSNVFKKDLKVALKRGLPMEHLRSVIDMLASGQALPERYRNHSLTGQYRGFQECHIEPDWLLVYRIDNNELELYLFRTGTHSDLF